MQSSYIEYIGFLAAFCGVVAFVPQVITTWKAKSASNVSLAMYIIYCLSIVLWLTYGILIHSIPLITAELLTFILAFSILVMKFMWK